MAGALVVERVMNHGTGSMYTKGGCRCAECGAAIHRYRARYYAEHAAAEKSARKAYYWKFVAHAPFTRLKARKGEDGKQALRKGEGRKQPLRLFMVIRGWLRDAGYRQCSKCRLVGRIDVDFCAGANVSWCRSCKSRRDYPSKAKPVSA